MRTCYVLCKEGSWQLKCTHKTHSDKILNKCFIRQESTKRVAKLRSCSRSHTNKLFIRRRYSRCSWACSSSHEQHNSSSTVFQEQSMDQNIDSSEECDSLNASDHVRKQRNTIWFYFLQDASNVFKADELGWDIAIIALPALLALAADPLASLVDTAFIGQIGSIELAAVGVSIAVFNLVSKLLNFPVLNLTTSFVAEEAIALENSDESDGSADSDEQRLFVTEDKDLSYNGLKKHTTDNNTDSSGRRILPAVSTALIVACVLGLLELIVLTVGAGPILDVMGVSVDSTMRIPAEQYLTLRAIGAPAVVVSLATQGVFRGFKDTKTPLFATVSGNIINMCLVPFLIFYLGYGVSGAAVATVISEYFIALTLLLKMNKMVVLLPPKLSDLEFDRFLKNGGLLLARSTAVMLTLTLATSQAARQGAIPMAAHQICMQMWLAASLLSDAIALAGQAIIASALAKGDNDLAKAAAFRTLQMGCAFGFILSILLGFGLSMFSKLFTNDPRVLQFLALGIPFVAATQPINSMAFVFDGLYFGALDFSYAAQSMILVAIMASSFLVIASSTWGFLGIWLGLTILMTLRMLAGFLRVGTASGPWKFLSDIQQ